MHRLFVVLTLLCSSAIAAEPSPTWALDFPESEGWAVGFTQKQGVEYMNEYTHNGESVEAWSQLVTYMYRKLPRNKFQDAVRLTKGGLQRGCPSLALEDLYQSDLKIVFAWRHDGCGGFAAQEVVVRLEYVGDGILSLQYAYYREKTKPDFEAWINRVKKAKIAQ